MTNKLEWHKWFCWYPVYSVEYGWVWLRFWDRKQVPQDYVDRARKKAVSARFSEWATGYWHRIPDKSGQLDY